MKRGSPLNCALGILSRRRVSRGQMRESMRRKGYSEEEVEDTLAKIGEWGYLDDDGYARDILRSMISECPLGRRRAEYELSKRLFEKDLIEAVVNEAFGGLREEEMASLAARQYLDVKRNGKSSESGSEKERERLARWLQRRGFGAESVYAALRSLGRSERD